jgi:glucosamine-6-phosphate deaminase
MKEFTKDSLKIKIYGTRDEMGRCAATDIAKRISELLSEKEEINIIFAAAPSQSDMLKHLISLGVDWQRINAYHMDEYIGLSKDAPQGFGNFLRREIFDKVPLRSVNLIDPEAQDPQRECERYSLLIKNNPPDLILLGIGENGHIAFNDPPVADFCDRKIAKPVLLDETCRRQQVNDGCFADISKVPRYAITLTVPVFKNAPTLFCVVPAKTKARAVKATVEGDVGETCPATVMRNHPDATLYLDTDSAGELTL